MGPRLAPAQNGNVCGQTHQVRIVGIMLKALLAHPLTKGLNIDDPETTHLRRQIIQGKVFLRKIYEEWYQSIAASLPSGDGAVLELGSGAGFMKDSVPNLITSEVFYCPDIRMVVS